MMKARRCGKTRLEVLGLIAIAAIGFSLVLGTISVIANRANPHGRPAPFTGWRPGE